MDNTQLLIYQKESKHTHQKKGAPMVRSIHEDKANKELSDAEGWLEGDEPFFDDIDQIVEDRMKHVPRVLNKFFPKNVIARYKKNK